MKQDGSNTYKMACTKVSIALQAANIIHILQFRGDCSRGWEVNDVGKEMNCNCKLQKKL